MNTNTCVSDGGGGASLTGYNREAIEAIPKKVEEIQNEVVQEIMDKIHSVFIKPMGLAWHAPEAVEEFETVKEALEGMKDKVAEAYQTFVGWCGAAGKAWADNTKGEAPKMGSIGLPSIVVDIAGITPEDRGNITLNVDEADNIAARMKDVKAEIGRILKEKHGKLQAATSLLGGRQSEAAEICFTAVGEAVNKLFGVTDTLSERVKKYAEKYREVSEDIASKMSSAHIDVTETEIPS